MICVNTIVITSIHIWSPPLIINWLNFKLVAAQANCVREPHDHMPVSLPNFHGVYAAVTFLIHQLHSIYGSTPASGVCSPTTAWRRAPSGAFETLCGDLRPGTVRSYQRVLINFHQWCIHAGRVLDTAEDVDLAACEYVGSISRVQGEYLLSALLRAFPRLRNELVYTASRLKANLVLHPTRHHAPTPWLLIVEFAYVWCLRGWPRRALLLMTQWLFGLRPAEAINLRGGDARCRLSVAWAGVAGFLQLGVRTRGAKARRPQIVRAHRADSWANWAFDTIARVAPPDARLCDIVCTAQHSRLWNETASILGYLWKPTPHSARAGWASWRCAAGQAVSDLQEDGRWSSTTSLRVYLDAIAATDIMAEQPHAGRRDFLVDVERRMNEWFIL